MSLPQNTNFSSDVIITNNIKSDDKLIIGNATGTKTELMKSLIIGTEDLKSDNSMAKINIQTKKGGTINIGNSTISKGNNINLFSGSQNIKIGGGPVGLNGNINIGSNFNGYKNTVNLVTGNSGDTLNLGSSSSTINLLGDITANSTTITPTLISYLSGLTGNIQQQLSDQKSEIEYARDISNYYTKNDVNNIFLDKTDASNIYLKISDADSQLYGKASLDISNTFSGDNIFTGSDTFSGDVNFLTQNPVYFNKLPMSNDVNPEANSIINKVYADITYLKQTDASYNYLKQSDASNTYLKQSDSSANYLHLFTFQTPIFLIKFIYKKN